MANIKKGTLTKTPPFCGWWKHLRKYGKRLYWKGERKAAKLERKNDH
jgi:hypothetical protein